MSRSVGVISPEVHDGLLVALAGPDRPKLGFQAELHEDAKGAYELVAERGLEGASCHQIRHAGNRGRRQDSLIDSESPYAVDDRKNPRPLEIDLVRRDPNGGHEGIEEAEARRRERLGQVSEAGDQRVLPAHQLDEGPLRLRRQTRNRPATGAASKKIAIFIAASGLRFEDPQAQLPKKPVQRLRPDRVAHHHVARAGGKAEGRKRPGEARSERVDFPGRKLPGKQQRVVLVRSDRLLAPALGSEENEAAVLADPRRGDHFEELAVEAPVEIGGDLRDQVDLQALPMETLDLVLNVPRGRREIVEAAGAIDPAGDQLRVAGKEAQEVDIFEEADERPIGADGEAPLAVSCHREQRVEDEVVAVDRDDLEPAQVAHRGVQRQAVEDDGLREVHAGDDADPRPFADEERVDVVVPHGAAGLLDRRRSLDEHRGPAAHVPDALAQDALHALDLARVGERIELAGNVRIEEGREGRIVADQRQDEFARERGSRASPPPRRNPRRPHRARGRGSRRCPSARAPREGRRRPGPRRRP